LFGLSALSVQVFRVTAAAAVAAAVCCFDRFIFDLVCPPFLSVCVADVLQLFVTVLVLAPTIFFLLILPILPIVSIFCDLFYNDITLLWF